MVADLRFILKFPNLTATFVAIATVFAVERGEYAYISSQHRAKNSSFEINQQLADQLEKDIFSIPWGHHMLLIDKFLTVPQKALFSCWIQNMPLFKVGSVII